jgi:hypothetical protein
MLPRLEAERSLSRISDTGAGSGTMPEADQRAHFADLRRAALGERVQRVKRGDGSRAELEAAMAEFRIQVEQA